MKALKNYEVCFFYFILKALFILRSQDISTFLTPHAFNNCNTHNAQYLTKKRQTDNEIWLGNRIYQAKYFSLKIIQKMRQGDLFETSLCFLKKFYMW